MADNAGLTHGAAYSQFGSKEAITIEAIRGALTESRRLWLRLADRNRPKQGFAAIVVHYLSPAHRDAPGQGCVVAALASEVARQPDGVRDAFSSELNNALAFLAELMPGDNSSDKYDNAIAAFASMAGTLVLARAVNDAAFSDRILKAIAKRLIGRSIPPGAARGSGDRQCAQNQRRNLLRLVPSPSRFLLMRRSMLILCTGSALRH